MPSICCASRCYNKSCQGYALARFPKEEEYKKAWLDTLGENAALSKRSVENLRLYEVHFEPSDIFVVGSRKEIKKKTQFYHVFVAVSLRITSRKQENERKRKHMCVILKPN
ncbi:uncharacterized protein LOC113005708 [Solenopsis invicta]|uniref:uncharacterized protein LOC113005708 n=1 Tax=Solenopsis invicta TaxID=13686 RepID=UPI000E340351|nr:uncharacterized protein LOC113005708 [Solenopsis invicta]XP_039314933.1 uncharacterized protein LOC113005708 [Solenopsis invicta]